MEWLLDRMRAWGPRPALIWRDREISYTDLVQTVDSWSAALEGIEAGCVVGMDARPTPRSIGLLLALARRGCIVVPLAKSHEANRSTFDRIAEVQVSISLDEDESPRLTRIATVPSNALTLSLAHRGAPGLVIFTSGTTGDPKAALHDLTRLLGRYEREHASVRMLTFLVLDAIGGINTLFRALSSGSTLIALDDRDPDSICAAIAAHRVEVLPVTPTFLNLLLMSDAHRRHDLSSLKRISYGTEVMPTTTLARVHEALPGVDLLQMYGLSELGILPTKSKEPTSPWIAISGADCETKIVDGTLRIRASTAMLGYLNAPSPFDADGFFDTQDEVEHDGDFLRILGRRTELVNVGGQKVHPTEVEDVLMRADNVVDVAVRGERNAILGQIVVARVVLGAAEDVPALTRRLRQHCRAHLPEYKIPVRVELATGPLHGDRFKKKR